MGPRSIRGAPHSRFAHVVPDPGGARPAGRIPEPRSPRQCIFLRQMVLRPARRPRPPALPPRGSEYAMLSRQIRETGLLDRRLRYYAGKIAVTVAALVAGLDGVRADR